MQTFKSLELLEQLQADVRQLVLSANYLKNLDPDLLLEAPAPGKWSVVQVLEHLNSYGRYYLLAIESSLKKEKEAVATFQPGWLGNYFTKLMRPSGTGVVVNKMQAPRNHRPGKDLDILPVLNAFLEQQQYLLELLEIAKKKNIGSIRTPISISRIIKLKVGDTFRFLIAHEQRHFVQINNTIAKLKELTGIFPAVHPAM